MDVQNFTIIFDVTNFEYPQLIQIMDLVDI